MILDDQSAVTKLHIIVVKNHTNIITKNNSLAIMTLDSIEQFILNSMSLDVGYMHVISNNVNIFFSSTHSN